MVHVDYGVDPECKRPYETFGEICIKCGDCGRFDRPPFRRSEIRLMAQSNPGIPPFWENPRAVAYRLPDGTWLRHSGKTTVLPAKGTLEEVIPKCWHNRDLDYVRWWIEGKSY